MIGTTAWLLSFLLSMRTSGRVVMKQNGRKQLDVLCSQVAVELSTLMFGGEQLPDCDGGAHPDAECAHVRGFRRRMQKKYGEHWGTAAIAESLWDEPASSCHALLVWRFQIFWQVVEAIDTAVVGGGLQPSSHGMPALMARSRCRRLTQHWLTEPAIGTEKLDDGNVVFNKDAKRGKHGLVPESKEMARHLCWQASVMNDERHVAIAVDATTISKTDLVSFAVRLPQSGETAFWLPVQARCYQ
jgi:hypothetical protein